MVNTLKEKLKQRKVFGIQIMSCSPAAVEVLARNGYDYVLIDAEHTALDVTELKEMILAARLHGISPIARVTGPYPVEIRKAFEMGAEGVIVPHIKTKEEMELCVCSAKFPPLGRRGYDCAVRSAGFGAGDYDADAYITNSNETELVIPMAEDHEFIENIDEILSVPGIDAISFGPADFALSKNIRVFYKMDMPEVAEALDTIIRKAAPKGIYVMAPALPATSETIAHMAQIGVSMLSVGTDLGHLNTSLQATKKTVIDPFLGQK